MGPTRLSYRQRQDAGFAGMRDARSLLRRIAFHASDAGLN